MTSPAKCTYCNSSDIVFDSSTGEYICCNCGLVLQRTNIDRSPEWRAFTEEERSEMERVGPPPTPIYDVGGLSTKIVPTKEREGDSQDPSKYLRLAKWQDRSVQSSPLSRSLPKVQYLINSVGLKLNCPQVVIERAIDVYRIAHSKGLLKGRALEAEIAASLYMACKLLDNPRTLHEIAQAYGISKVSIAKAYRELSWSMGSPKKTDEAELILVRLANKLGISGKLLNISLNLLKSARERKLTSGRSPKSLAAACIYLASVMTNSELTQKEIASAGDVTEVTLRNRYKEMIQALDLANKER